MSEYRNIYTVHGCERWATAERTQTPLPINTWAIAIGDGGGSAVEPDPEQTALVNEVWRGPISRIYPHLTDPTRYYAEVTIPASVGGWTRREIALVDEDGELVLVGNLPGIYKATLAERVAQQDVMAVEFFVANAGLISLAIDPAIQSVSRALLEQRVAEYDALLLALGAAGTWRQVVVNARGQVIAGANPTTLAGYGITDAAPRHSPALEGDPTTPTPDLLATTLQIVNAAFVQGRIALGFELEFEDGHGHIKLPDYLGGLIINIGKTPSVDSGWQEFHKPFTTEVYGIFAQALYGVTISNGDAATTNVKPDYTLEGFHWSSGVEWEVNDTFNPQPIPAFYVAFGK